MPLTPLGRVCYGRSRMDQAASLTTPGISVLVAAADWLVAVLLGSVATAIAVLAIAGIGFLALAGRIELRRSGAILLGCFLLFGARNIAAGLLDLVHGDAAPVVASTPPATLTFTPPPPQPNAPSNYDPYAGASVPPG